MSPLQLIIFAEKVLKPFDLFAKGFYLALDSYTIAKSKTRATTRRKSQTK